MNKTNSLYTTRKRLLSLILAVISLFFALLIRLAYIQIIKGSEYTLKATDQWYRDLPLSAPRGKILDANGQVLADNEDVFTIYARPRAITDKVTTAYHLASELGLDKEKIYTDLTTSFVSEITIARQVPVERVTNLRNLGLVGVYFSPNTKRSYPNENYLSQIIGFTNIDNVGQGGIEGYYNQYLTGTDGFAYTNTDLAGREIEDSITKYVPAISGMDLTLGVDVNIQAFAEQAVFSAYTQWNAKKTSMLVMDVTDGAIVASSSYPSYDLNDPPRNDIDLLNALSKNSMIVDVYEPGSTFKIFTTAAALENNIISSNKTYYCPGYRIVDGQRIKCWKTIGHGSQTLVEGIMNSCNCVFMDLALDLGVDNFYSALKSYGFSTKTGIDFYGESAGILMPQSSVKPVDLARIGFGHAVAVTPLQLLTATAAIVNGGNLYEPYFLKNVTAPDGTVIYEHQAKVVRKVVSEQTSSTMRTLLTNVVSEGGGKKAGVAGYAIGGKTGTAQKYENGVVASGKYVSSFVGFAPADNPKYAILMVVDEPTGGAYYGSLVAAPSASEVFEKIFNYKQIAPTENIVPDTYVDMPNLIGKGVQEAEKILKELGILCEMAGDGVTVNLTLPAPQTKVPVGDIVLLRAE